MSLVSVIIPVYNVEKYLHRCLNSVKNQSFKNLDVILIDDGSTDKSGEICENYCKEDFRFRVIHQKNRGQATARNLALDMAKGDYICFVDSDDYIEKTMIETLYNSITNNNADIAVCGYNRVNETGELIKTFFPFNSEGVLNKREAVLEILKDIHLFSFLWDKIFKRELFKNIRLPENKLFEDVATVYKIVQKAEKIIVIPLALYNYVERNSSTIASYSDRRFRDQLEAFYGQEKFAKQHHYDEAIPWINYHITETKRRILYWYISTGKKDQIKKILKELKREYRKELIFIITRRELSRGRKIAALVLSLLPWMYQWMFKIKNKGMLSR